MAPLITALCVPNWAFLLDVAFPESAAVVVLAVLWLVLTVVASEPRGVALLVERFGQ